MTPSAFLHDVLFPGISWYQTIPEWVIPTDDRARLLMLAIAGQESNWTERVQGGGGPAHSYFQDEKNGAIRDVLTSPITKHIAEVACARSFTAATPQAVWELFAKPQGDKLAVAFARLTLWLDPEPLPKPHEMNAAWEYYLRNWRPGKPSITRWHIVYPQAVAAIGTKPA